MAVHATQPGTMAGMGPARDVRAWDLPTRVFKWTLVALIAIAYVTYTTGNIAWHVINGYAILVLVTFRLLWGLFGSSTARFTTWVTWPWNALLYGLDLVRGRTRHYLGHNPLGGWMIIALATLIIAQGVSGLWTVDSNGVIGGPFANTDFSDPTPTQRFLSRYHHWIYYVLLGFAALHVTANVVYQFVKKDPLISAMVVGTKPAERFEDQAEMRSPPMLWGRALLCLAAACVIVLGAVKLGGGSLPDWP